jgi:hypothetical protein
MRPGGHILLKLKSIAAATAFCLAGLAGGSANAWEWVNWSGDPSGHIWGAPWTPSLNTIANSPIRWDPGDAAAQVYYQIFYEGRTDAYTAGATLPGLAASVILTLDEVGNAGKQWTFDYAIYNASNHLNGNLVTDSRVTSLSMDVDPDETSATLLSGGFWTSLARDINLTAGSNANVQDICIKSGNTSNCNGGGGAGQGIELGQTGGGAFVLNFANAPTEVVFTDILVRFQGIDFTYPTSTTRRGVTTYSYTNVVDASGTGIAVAWVPEPGAWALMILGFGGVGALMRRRRAMALA